MTRDPLRETTTMRPSEVARAVARLVRAELGEEVRVFWFGSWVTGEPAARSDVDVALDAGRTVEPMRMTRILDAVDGLPTLRSIDLVDLHAVGEQMRRRIRETGRAL